MSIYNCDDSAAHFLIFQQQQQLILLQQHIKNRLIKTNRINHDFYCKSKQF